MDTEEVATNIDANAFLPSKVEHTSRNNKAGKKRTISSTASGQDDQQMQVDEATGIEGGRKSNAPKNKRKKHTNAELRKIAVPPHRFVCAFEITTTYSLLLNISTFLPQIHTAEG